EEVDREIAPEDSEAQEADRRLVVPEAGIAEEDEPDEGAEEEPRGQPTVPPRGPPPSARGEPGPPRLLPGRYRGSAHARPPRPRSFGSSWLAHGRRGGARGDRGRRRQDVAPPDAVGRVSATPRRRSRARCRALLLPRAQARDPAPVGPDDRDR